MNSRLKYFHALGGTFARYIVANILGKTTVYVVSGTVDNYNATKWRFVFKTRNEYEVFLTEIIFAHFTAYTISSVRCTIRLFDGDVATAGVPFYELALSTSTATYYTSSPNNNFYKAAVLNEKRQLLPNSYYTLEIDFTNAGDAFVGGNRNFAAHHVLSSGFPLSNLKTYDSAGVEIANGTVRSVSNNIPAIYIVTTNY